MKSLTKTVNICFINHFGYPLYNKTYKVDFSGGAEVQLFFISRELAKYENYRISVITGMFNMEQNIVEILDRVQLYKVLPLQRKLLNYLKGIINFFTTLKIINPDIVIQRTASITTFMAAIYCKIFRKKFIYSISSQKDVNGIAENIKFLGRLYRFGLNNASYIVAQNEDQIQDFEKYKKKKIANIEVIKNCYEIKDFEITEKKIILWVGRSIRLKRPEIFLELARNYPNEEFVIICNKRIDENYWQEIYTSSLKIPNVKFIESVPFHDIMTFYAKAKVLVNTSTYEGFPNTFIEALISKTPILSLNVNPDDIFTKYKIGYFCNNDISKLISNLQLILNDPNLNKTFSQNSLLYVNEHHNASKIGKEWLNLIKKLAS